MNYNKYKLVTFLKINNPAFIYVFNMFNRKNLRIMKGLVYQTPLFQLVINFIMAILETAGVLERVVSILK